MCFEDTAKKWTFFENIKYVTDRKKYIFPPFSVFFIWILFSPHWCHQNIRIYNKTDCQASRPSLIIQIQEIIAVFVIWCLPTFVQVTLCVWSYDKIKNKHSWPFLSDVGDTTTYRQREEGNKMRKASRVQCMWEEEKEKQKANDKLKQLICCFNGFLFKSLFECSVWLGKS